MIDTQRLTNLFTFNKNLHFAILKDSVINFLTLLDANIANKLRSHFGRVKNVIPEHRVDERHYESIFCGFFRLNRRTLLPDLG
ncbi:hypothetical protein D3C78_1404960 [compost metagenome]